MLMLNFDVSVNVTCERTLTGWNEKKNITEKKTRNVTDLVELRAHLLECADPADLGRGRHLGIHVHVLIVRPRGIESTTQVQYFSSHVCKSLETMCCNKLLSICRSTLPFCTTRVACRVSLHLVINKVKAKPRWSLVSSCMSRMSISQLQQLSVNIPLRPIHMTRKHKRK